MTRPRTIRLITILLLALAGLFTIPSHSTVSLSPVLHSQAAPPPLKDTQVSIEPGNITDVPRSKSKLTVSVNITDSPSFNAFEAIILYNQSAMYATSLDFASSILGSAATPVIYCIDGTAPPPNTCDQRYSRIGEIALALNLLQGQTGNVTTPKTLFKINFNVNSSRTGFSQIHIYSVTLGLVPSPKDITQTIVTKTFDGWYTDQYCPAGSGTACERPTVRVTFTPNPAPKDSLVTFQVNVTEINSGAKELKYTWDFGDGTQHEYQTNTTFPTISEPKTHQFLASRYGIDTHCVNQGLCLVQLGTYNSQGVTWQTTVPVPIPFLNIVLSVGESASEHFQVIPGTIVRISAQIVNTGNVAENASLRVRLEQVRNLTTGYFPNIPAIGGEVNLTTTWDTSRFSPRAYAIIAESFNTSIAQPINGKIITTLNASSRPVATDYIVLVPPITPGLINLSLIQTTGLGILIIVAIAIGLVRFRKKPSYEREPL